MDFGVEKRKKTGLPFISDDRSALQTPFSAKMKPIMTESVCLSETPKLA